MGCGLPNFRPKNLGNVQENGTTLSTQNWSGAREKRADTTTSSHTFKALADFIIGWGFLFGRRQQR